MYPERRAEREPVPARWDPVASRGRGSPCSFPLPAALHAGRGGLGQSCHGAERDGDAGEAGGSCTEALSAGSSAVPFYFHLPQVLLLYSVRCAVALR